MGLFLNELTLLPLNIEVSSSSKIISIKKDPYIYCDEDYQLGSKFHKYLKNAITATKRD